MKQLEKLERIELEDWGSFYVQEGPYKDRDEEGEYIYYIGVYVDADAVQHEYCRLEVFPNEDDLFLFSVVDQDGEVLVTNL